MHLHTMLASDVGMVSHAVLLSGWTSMTCFWRSRNHGLWSVRGLYVLLDAWPGDFGWDKEKWGCFSIDFVIVIPKYRDIMFKKSCNQKNSFNQNIFFGVEN